MIFNGINFTSAISVSQGKGFFTEEKNPSVQKPLKENQPF